MTKISDLLQVIKESKEYTFKPGKLNVSLVPQNKEDPFPQEIYYAVKDNNTGKYLFVAHMGAPARWMTRGNFTRFYTVEGAENEIWFLVAVKYRYTKQDKVYVDKDNTYSVVEVPPGKVTKSVRY